uniref:Uncharacterized protein n=1 Tax=Siphoviridae sp. ctmpG14 TaxID=2825654 RepID=A0A8S5PC11_9CAUD|nr:MAG TPA: hypothetical protein [Siphoviridae sp. ctmpG14]
MILCDTKVPLPVNLAATQEVCQIQLGRYLGRKVKQENITLRVIQAALNLTIICPLTTLQTFGKELHK